MHDIDGGRIYIKWHRVFCYIDNLGIFDMIQSEIVLSVFTAFSKAVLCEL